RRDRPVRGNLADGAGYGATGVEDALAIEGQAERSGQSGREGADLSAGRDSADRRARAKRDAEVGDEQIAVRTEGELDRTAQAGCNEGSHLADRVDSLDRAVAECAHKERSTAPAKKIAALK